MTRIPKKLADKWEKKLLRANLGMDRGKYMYGAPQAIQYTGDLLDPADPSSSRIEDAYIKEIDDSRSVEAACSPKPAMTQENPVANKGTKQTNHRHICLPPRGPVTTPPRGVRAIGAGSYSND